MLSLGQEKIGGETVASKYQMTLNDSRRKQREREVGEKPALGGSMHLSLCRDRVYKNVE